MFTPSSTLSFANVYTLYFFLQNVSVYVTWPKKGSSRWIYAYSIEFISIGFWGFMLTKFWSNFWHPEDCWTTGIPTQYFSGMWASHCLPFKLDVLYSIATLVLNIVWCILLFSIAFQIKHGTAVNHSYATSISQLLSSGCKQDLCRLTPIELRAGSSFSIGEYQFTYRSGPKPANP